LSLAEKINLLLSLNSITQRDILHKNLKKSTLCALFILFSLLMAQSEAKNE
jgi:hypothetical protein